MSLSVAGLGKSFGAVRAVADLSLEVGSGEFVTLLGPSGCGKTTALRCIAGIYGADKGHIVLDGRDITAAPMHRRNLAMVFQNYALFPHLSAFDNVAFGLRSRGVPRAELRRRTEEALALVRLQTMAARRPQELSGGQQQRVALARALVVQPALLLLDEPLSNLDARLRDDMRGEIRDLQRRLRITTLLVTHDIAEAFALSDRIAVMQGGRIAQDATPQDIYHRPANRFVAHFVGPASELPLAAVGTADARPCGTLSGGMRVWLAAPPADAIRAPMLLLRPERLRLGDAAHGAANCFEADVADVVFLGGGSEVRLRLGEATLLATLPSGAAAGLRPGDRIPIGWDAEDAVVLDAA